MGARPHNGATGCKGWFEWHFWRLLRLQPLSARPLPSGMVMARSGAKRGRRFGLRASQPVKCTEHAREGTHAPHRLLWRPGMLWFDYSVDRRASATPVMSSCGRQRCGVQRTGRATAVLLPVVGFPMVETLPTPCSRQEPFSLGDDASATEWSAGEMTSSCVEPNCSHCMQGRRRRDRGDLLA